MCTIIHVDTPRDKSPFGLIQEELRDEPWKLLIACSMLNLTNIKQVRPVFQRFIERYPSAASAAQAIEMELADLVRPLGLYNRRARSIIAMSKGWLQLGPRPALAKVAKLKGVGPYALDSYRIFVEGVMDVEPKDSKLLKYVGWARGKK